MKVLVTLDGSPLADRALEAFGRWASRLGAEVDLLTVLDARDSQDVIAAPGRPGGYVATLATRGKVIPESPTVIVDRGRELEAARVNTEDALRERASNYLPGLPVGVHAEFAEDAADCITKFARDQGMSFIVMSTHGRSGLGQALLGSVAGQVVHTATVPVILVGPHVQP